MQHPPRPHSQDSAVARTVLVVEDDQSIALGLRINLEKEGYAVQVETDGLAT